ncbi:MAG: hypothetical protein JWM31_1392, partial [Solirubrobacterales bacterium]|nr:hypothetical protein [Solirubrobacterales bacterium]
KLQGLDSSDGSASGGVKDLQGAVDSAASSAGRLTQGGGRLRTGVGRLSTGISAAASGAKDLDRTVGAATAGTGAIAAAVSGARTTAQQLAQQLKVVGEGEAQVAPVIRGFQSRAGAGAASIRSAVEASGRERTDALGQIATARRALLSSRQSVGTLAALSALNKAQATLQGDPVAALPALADGLDADARTAGHLAAALSGVAFHDLAVKARTLASLLGTADRNQGTLVLGVKRLAGAVSALRAALDKLGGGTSALSGGLATLDAGIAQLQSGASSGRAQTARLAQGLSGARNALADVTTGGETGAGSRSDTGSSARGAISSGYFVLAALDAEGAKGATTGLNVDGGGQAARMIVIPRSGPNDPATRALGLRIAAATRSFAQRTRTESAVGGPAAMLADYQRATAGRLLTIVLALALATALLLALVLRSVPIAVAGVALNLLAVGATLGILDHLFTGTHPLLGGPGQLDATALTAVFAVMFALSTDYQVFVVTRVREELAAGLSPRAAVAAGISRTARVVTGAALSMVAVFLAFATADVASLQQFGIGLAIAVALDATVIRLVLLPALLALGGRGAWWPGLPAGADGRERGSGRPPGRARARSAP